jgi:hypothetical protein
LRPTVLVRCTSEEDVVQAVRFASRCGYKVTARSGGHSYTGASSCNFDRCMQLDLGPMNATKVPEGSSQIISQPGIGLLGFAEFTVKHFLSIPHGGCARVGMGGHMQSSAWGMMTQSHGSGLDHIESFRMVTADGQVKSYARTDQNDTVYRSVLGSAPGSWGVITEFTFTGIHDLAVPWTRAITISLLYSKASLLAAFKQTQFIAKDQEDRNVRDMKVLLVTAPGTTNSTHRADVYIRLFAMWTGLDTGPMTEYWKDRYLQPYWDLPHVKPSVDVPLPLSVVTRLFADSWVNHDDRYSVQAFHSDHWWSDEFIDLIVDEVDDRVESSEGPLSSSDVYPSFQFMPMGLNSQWSRNKGLNSLPWRDVRAYVDDWMFVKNESQYDFIRKRQRDFRDKTKPYWQYKDGSDRSTFMSPMTTYERSTDLKNETTRRGYFPDDEAFAALQRLKAELDPRDLFANTGTIPLPVLAESSQVV